MKTAKQIGIDNKFNQSAHMYREMHKNGHYNYVLDYLKKNKGSMTSDILYREVCIRGNEQPFNDSQGAYAGTHCEIRYMGHLVMAYTNWSLFN